MSDPAVLVLISLADGPKHGYAMMLDIEQFSGSRLGPGTLYGAISRLEEQRWIAPAAGGKAELAAELSRLSRFVRAGELRLKGIT
jgi:DNA-binding PadR family transcriptional regulator